MTFLLPFLEEQALFDQLDLKLSWDHPHNLSAFKQEVEGFQNPGFLEKEANRDQQGLSLTNYSGNVHVLGGVRQLTTADITDGTANTIMAGEIVQRFPPWGRPGNWRDPAKGISRSPLGFGGPWRMHGAGAGATILFLDGSVRFVKETVDPKVLEALGTPRGGEAIATDAY
jgi:prepilin-type processing-associated H-X9-DG protein